jgi:GAF domain-containing protein
VNGAAALVVAILLGVFGVLYLRPEPPPPPPEVVAAETAAELAALERQEAAAAQQAREDARWRPILTAAKGVAIVTAAAVPLLALVAAGLWLRHRYRWFWPRPGDGACPSRPAGST